MPCYHLICTTNSSSRGWCWCCFCVSSSCHPLMLQNKTLDYIPTALMMNPFGDRRALRIHASLSTSRLFAFPCMKSTKFSIHPWKDTSAMALTSLLFQKLREFCALKSAKISWPLVVLALNFPPPARKLSSSGPKTTAREAAESWTSRCWWDMSAARLSTPEGDRHDSNEKCER